MTTVHLVDDTTPGGVVRFLDFLTAAAHLGPQEVVSVRRGRWSAPAIEAEVIVSHLVLSWRNLPMMVALRARYPGTPIIHVEHHYTPAFVEAEVRHPARFETMLRAGFSLFDKVVAVSNAQASWLTQNGLVDAAALSVIQPAVQLSAFSELSQQSGPVRRIAAIGRLEAIKGLDLVIEALAQTDGLELHIHGEGPERARLEQLATSLPVVFHGHSDPVDALAKADAVVMPSRREAYGLVALEARAAGRPVLVSGIDGLSDHVTGGAIAVENTVDNWAAALQGLDALISPFMLAVSRRRAMASGRSCLERWHALLQEHRHEEARRSAA